MVVTVSWCILQKCHRSAIGQCASLRCGGHDTVQRDDGQGLAHGRTMLRDLDQALDKMRDNETLSRGVDMYQILA